MPEYKFNARDKQGQTIQGQRNAPSDEELALELINEGLIPSGYFFEYHEAKRCYQTDTQLVQSKNQYR